MWPVTQARLCSSGRGIDGERYQPGPGSLRWGQRGADPGYNSKDVMLCGGWGRCVSALEPALPYTHDLCELMPGLSNTNPVLSGADKALHSLRPLAHFWVKV